MSDTQAQVIEFEVEYTATCPTCQDSGQTVQLGYSVANGGIICQTGKHRFEEMPGSDKPAAAGAQASPGNPASADAPAMLADAPEMRLRAFSGDPAPKKGINLQEIKDRINEQTQEAMRAKSKAPGVAKAAVKLNELPEPAPLPEVKGTVTVVGACPVEAGELSVILRLSERHASAVTAEAAIQNQTVPAYLQQWLTQVLDDFWGR